jgi:arsenite methyltransferase
VGGNETRGFVPVDDLMVRTTSPNGAPESDTIAPAQATLPLDLQVKQRYDKLAQTGASTLCCSPRDIYTAEDMAGVPDWVLELSSGCGSPLDSIALRPGQTVADFGCGAGLDLILAARRVGSEGKVIGVDASTNMVRTARKAAKEVGADNIEVRVGDLRRPPLRDGTIDVLLCNCVLAMFPDKGMVLAEIARVLSPGGYAVISDVIYPDAALLVPEDPASEEWSSCVVGMTRSEYEAMILGCGFARVEWREEKTVQYRDGADVISATILAYRGDSPDTPCC